LEDFGIDGRMVFKKYIKEVRCDDVCSIYMAQDRVQWLSFENTAVKIPLQQNLGNFLIN
jgi:hypothetical protein